MKIEFLGTGASEGFPAIFCECEYCKKAKALGGKNLRRRTAVKIDDNVLIDFSMDTYSQVLAGKLDLTKIEHVLITHSHEDHFCPTDIVSSLPPMATNRNKKLHVYGNGLVKRKLEKVIVNRMSIEESKQYLEIKEESVGEEFKFQDYTVMPVAAKHDSRESCLLYIIQREGKTLLFAHDSAMFSEETMSKVLEYHYDCVVLDCTSVFTDKAFEGHMSFFDNLEIKKCMLAGDAADENTIFISTHFVHMFGPFHETLTDEMKAYGFAPAYDGLQITF